jgi:putative Holliday junction resolvase
MTIRKPADLLDGMAPGMRVLGLDLGTRTIGLALSDVGRQIASPYETVRRSKLKADIERIRDVVAREGVGGFVLGLPLNMDGSEGPRCQATRQFAADLGKAIDLPLCFWDERLSTFAAENLLIEGGMSRRKRGQVIDKVAAAVILQGCLDHVARQPPAART